MLLAVDIGNTNVTLGLVRAGQLVATRRAMTHPRQTADELEHILDGLLRLDDVGFADISAIVAASVVPSLTATLEQVAQRRERPILLATAGTIPIAVRVDRPSEVGADRLVNALRRGALPPRARHRRRSRHGDDVRLRRAPTARTSAGRSPRGSSWASTRSRRGPPSCRGSSCGRPTAPSAATPSRRSRAAPILGYQALVTGLLRRIREELADETRTSPQRVMTILTGGVGERPWAEGVDGVDAIDPELTLRGLALLHTEVTAGRPLDLELR